jgi:hypothetical protein
LALDPECALQSRDGHKTLFGHITSKVPLLAIIDDMQPLVLTNGSPQGPNQATKLAATKHLNKKRRNTGEAADIYFTEEY